MCRYRTLSFGVIPNKPDAIEVAGYLTEKYKLKDGKIRMYWSACQKGCGIHGLGDIGFVGVKFKKNGQTKVGVNMYYGGTLTDKSEEGKLLVKDIPLEDVKFYVEELIIEYINLKKPKESFENFYKRVLKRVSKEALRFLIFFNNITENRYPSLRISLNEHILNNHFEEEEIFAFGYQIYRKATGKIPYSKPNILEIYDEPEPEKPNKVNKDFPKELDEIVMKMINKRPEKRYKVFTEIEEDLKKIFI